MHSGHVDINMAKPIFIRTSDLRREHCCVFVPFNSTNTAHLPFIDLHKLSILFHKLLHNSTSALAAVLSSLCPQALLHLSTEQTVVGYFCYRSCANYEEVQCLFIS